MCSWKPICGLGKINQYPEDLAGGGYPILHGAQRLVGFDDCRYELVFGAGSFYHISDYGFKIQGGGVAGTADVEFLLYKESGVERNVILGVAYADYAT